MSFMRLGGEGQLDSDRVGLGRFLTERGLQVDHQNESSSHLLDSDGIRLEFDGRSTDLFLDPFDKPGNQGGGIFHATISAAEMDFIFDLCVAASFLAINHQCSSDSPMFIIPARNHDASELEELVKEASYLFVDTAAQMRNALLGDLEQFVEFRDRVIGRK